MGHEDLAPWRNSDGDAGPRGVGASIDAVAQIHADRCSKFALRK